MLLKSWVSPKAEKGKPSQIHGKGIFAKYDVEPAELLAVKAGHIIDGKTLRRQSKIINHAEMQIADDLYIAPLSNEGQPLSMIYFNHSCDPNCLIQGQIALVARRAISAGEELTVDYSTHFDCDEIIIDNCNCGAKNCRQTINGKDWQKPSLQKLYGDSFSWHLLRKIKGIKA